MPQALHAEKKLRSLNPLKLGTHLFVWIEVFVVFLVFFIDGGSAAPDINEPHYLCRLKHFWDPTWCSGDLFLDSPDAHFTIVWTLGWFTRFFSLETTAWIGRVLAWMLLACGWHQISSRLLNHRWFPVFSAMLFAYLVRTYHLAGEWIIGGIEAKCFAYGFLFLALAKLYDCFLSDEAAAAERDLEPTVGPAKKTVQKNSRKHWNAIWILLGVASACHVLIGGWGVIFLGLTWAFQGRRTVSLRDMLPGLLLGGLFSLAGLIPAIQLTQGIAPDLIEESNRIYVFERLPHHLAPLSQLPKYLNPRLQGHGILLLWFMLSSFLFFSKKVGSQIKTDEGSKLSRRVERRYLIGITTFACCSLGLALLGFLIEIVLKEQPLVAARFLRYYLFRLTDIGVPIAVTLQTFYLMRLLLAHPRSQKFGLALFLVCVSLSGFYMVGQTRKHFVATPPPADGRMRDYEAWVQTCDWVVENTPPEALFLVPRHAQTFKWRTGRPELVTFKDIPQDAPHMITWFKRLEDVYRVHAARGGASWVVSSPAQLGTKRVKELAEKYSFEYVVSRSDPGLSLPIVYLNRAYVIYKIPSKN